MNSVLRYILVVATTLVVLILLWQFRIALLLFALSLAVAAALRPSINRLAGPRVSRGLALAIVYFVLVVSILGSLLLIGQPLARDLQNATDDFVTGYERAVAVWPDQGSMFQQMLAERLPPSDELYNALTSPDGVPALAGIFGAAQNFFSILGRIAIIIILSLYWSVDQLRFERLGLSLLPKEIHPRALHVWRTVEGAVGAYLRSEVVQSVLAGLLLGLAYWLMGIRYPALFTLWAVIARLIPWLGVVIAALPLLFVEMANSPLVSLTAAIYTVGILLILKIVVEPRYLRRERYSSLLIVIFVIILAESFGVVGVMLAPLLALTIQILFEQLYPATSRRYSREMLEKVIELRRRLRETRLTLQQSATRSRETALVMDKLNYLMKRVAEYIQEY